MAYKKVCVSFDYEHDKKEYFLLEAWTANKRLDFGIDDCTPNEIQTESVYMVKNVLSKKIGEANYMIAIIGQHSNDRHPDSDLIGYRNWQAYEIAKNREKGNKLVVVFLDKSYVAPTEASYAGVKWVYSFEMDKIVDALNSF